MQDGYFNFGMALTTIPGLTPACREVVILTVGHHYGSPYEMYSHSRMAIMFGLSKEQVQDLQDGKKPRDCKDDEDVAWEITDALIVTHKKGSKAISPEIWEKAERVLGKEGCAAVIHFTAFYAYTCILLNGAAVPLPKGETVSSFTQM